jgi:cell division septation protein DedD
MVKHAILLSLCCIMVVLSGGCSRQQSDWQKTRETNTAEGYEQFAKKYPNGEFTAQAEAEAKYLYQERDWQKARDADTPEAYQNFVKQYPEGKWTEEARIRVENFTLAQVPGSSPNSPGGASADTASAAVAGAAAGVAAGAAASGAPPTAAPAKAPVVMARAASSGSAAAAPSASTAPVHEAKAARKGTSGSYRVQLGAFKSGAVAAKQHWTELKHEYPTLLKGLSSKVIPKTTADGKLYRLMATGLSGKHAHHLCSVLKAKSQACIVVPPAKS